MTSKQMSGTPHAAQDPGRCIVDVKSGEQMDDELAKKFIKRTGDVMDDTQRLLDQAVDARAAMEMLTEKWKLSWIEFQETGDSRLRELRMTRIAIDSEMRQLMASFREVRTFFLDEDYETERSRLVEFVDLCERLKRLKECGFLDTVADTMLKLATPESH